MSLAGALFIPNLNLVTIGIGNVSIGQPRAKFTATQKAAASGKTFIYRDIDVRGIREAKSEMYNAS